jgi:hypothetical protein
MSNHLAIATVTAVLQRTLQASVQRNVEAVRISTVPPHRLGQGTPETGINVFLYQVTRNNALKNPDALAMRSRNKRTPWRQSALELHYLLSFYGNDAELEPQRLLGSVVRTFNDRTTLPIQQIQEALNDSTFAFLAASDLATQVQDLQIIPEDLNLEDLSKIWSVFFQTPYALSLAYKVTAVVIDGETPAERALLVRDQPTAGVLPFSSRPHLDRITALDSPSQPILPDSTVQIQGQQLQGTATRLRLGGVDVVPATVSQTHITVPLTTVPIAALQAGVQGIQIVHLNAARHPAESSVVRPCTMSNSIPLTLCPVIKSVQVTELDVWDDDHCMATLQLEVSPRIRPGQSVLLSLYEWSVHSPATYLIEVPPLLEECSLIAIPLEAIKPGNYLVRLIVDGAESPLGQDENPDSETFQWSDRPRVCLHRA